MPGASLGKAFSSLFLQGGVLQECPAQVLGRPSHPLSNGRALERRGCKLRPLYNPIPLVLESSGLPGLLP